MALKDLWAKVGNLGTRRKKVEPVRRKEEGADTPAMQSIQQEYDRMMEEATVQKVEPQKRENHLEKINEGFTRLVEQLEGIHTNLERQVGQHRELMSRLERIPALLEKLPEATDNQRRSIDAVLDQLQGMDMRNRQFVEAVEKIPGETAKQSEMMSEMNMKLAAASDADQEMARQFTQFKETLAQLDRNTAAQTDSILQMSQTFATSDKFMKYMISEQHKRFRRIFVVTAIICLVAIGGLLAGLLLVLRANGVI